MKIFFLQKFETRSPRQRTSAGASYSLALRSCRAHIASDFKNALKRRLFPAIPTFADIGGVGIFAW
jgi:hypothetical protein